MRRLSLSRSAISGRGVHFLGMKRIRWTVSAVPHRRTRDTDSSPNISFALRNRHTRPNASNWSQQRNTPLANRMCSVFSLHLTRMERILRLD
jgi:hypothetical protein